VAAVSYAVTMVVVLDDEDDADIVGDVGIDIIVVSVGDGGALDVVRIFRLYNRSGVAIIVVVVVVAAAALPSLLLSLSISSLFHDLCH